MQIRKCHADAANANANADTNGIRIKNSMSPSPSVGDIINQPMRKGYFSHRQAQSQNLSCWQPLYEPRHDKTNKISVLPAKSQNSLGIHPSLISIHCALSM